MKILLTGANGFTGRHFYKYAKIMGHNVEAFSGDLISYDETYRNVIDVRPDAVVHLAAISHVDHHELASFYNVNTVGTVNLLNALIESKIDIKKILLASSANVYGNATCSPLSESVQPFPVNHYAMSKLSMEYLSLSCVDKLPIFITRPFNYTGPGQSPDFVISKLVQHFATNRKIINLGNLHIKREYNNVKMICECYLKLLNMAEVGHTYNICTGYSYSIMQIMQMLEDITGHNIEVKQDPALIRSNDIINLTGDPSKLNNCIGEFTNFSLHDTLTEMLNFY